MQLVDLPTDLLVLLPQFLHNLEGRPAEPSGLLSPEHHLTPFSASPLLLPESSPTRSHFLMAATARQISDWAILSHVNTETLRQAFQGSIDTLFELCISKVGLMIEDIRRLQASRFSLISPVSDTLVLWAGNLWYTRPD